MVTAAALVSGLVAGVTLHYLGSPCLVRPHPLVTANISAVVARGMRAGAEVARDTEEEGEGEAILLENWTRWRLQLDSGETVPPHSALSLAPGVSEIFSKYFFILLYSTTEVPAGGLVLVAARLQGEAECGA